MKNILGHKSYNMEEVIDILYRTGTFTCPTLPHYRYNRIKTVCGQLQNRGFLKQSGRSETGRNLVVTERFKEWKTEFDNGITKLRPIKWQKNKYPITQKRKPHDHSHKNNERK
jgi:hypothetical protein